jgi:protein-S-isoprenylcysteine O-methyltransferase Ste14
MTRRIVLLAISAAAWCGFVAITVWTMAFLTGVALPRTVDGPARMTTSWAVAIDLALLLLFAAQHSVMARRPAKSWLRRRVPAELERTTYVLATNLCLALLLALWQPWDQLIWQVEGVTAYALWALCAAGWVLAIAATFAVDHLELIGLRQAGWGAASRSAVSAPEALKVSGLHAIVRHPLMTGLVLAFWATPRMSAPHLLFAVAATGYVAVGLAFEERDLRRTFGAAYDAYAARVPAVVPGLRAGRGNDASAARSGRGEA